MPKVTLSTIGSRYGSIDALNNNFDEIEDAIENTLSRDGTSPNEMLANLNMGGNDIINVGNIFLDSGENIVDEVDAAIAAASSATSSAANAATSAAQAAISASAVSNQVAAVTPSVARFTGDGVTTEYTLPSAPGAEENTLVFINGVYQQKDTYSLSGNTLTFSEAPVADTSNIEVQIGPSVQINLSSALGVSYQPEGAGAQITNVQAKLREQVSVLDFGADPTGVADSTAAIQAALDFAASSSSRIRRVFFPAGTYSTSTVYVPTGVVVEGEGISETTARTVTKLVQRTVGDVIRFIPQDTGGKLYWFGAIRRLAIFGDSALASGWGISFRNSAGATVSMQDLSCLEDLVVRRCPSGGIEIPNSGLPITLQRIKLLFNNGPGIHMTSVTTHQHQGINFTDISGDGNDGGLIKLSGLDRSGSVNIFNLKSENRINSDYGSVGMQENAIVLNGCNGTPINIFGVTHICSIPDGANFVKPGSVIKILDANFPEINWSGVAVRVRVGDTGPDPSIVEYSTTVAIPYTTTSGRFGNSNFSHVTQANGLKQTFGPVSSYQADSDEDTAMQVAGTTPAYSLYETDASADSKAWIMVASGGNFTLRAINDNGTLGQIIWTATRTALQVGPDSAGTYLRINGINQTSAVAGAASALPAAPVGYITVNINGTDRRIPYYATA
jgi:hypothetical protein